jgi:hypothetical protein
MSDTEDTKQAEYAHEYLLSSKLAVVTLAQLLIEMSARFPGLGGAPVAQISPFGAAASAPGAFTGQSSTADLTFEQFISVPPETWRGNPASVTRFKQLFGLKALAIFNAWGFVVGHKLSQYAPTPEQLAYFNDDGARAYYLVAELRQMPPDVRRLLASNITDEFLRDQKADMKLYTSNTLGTLSILGG